MRDVNAKVIHEDRGPSCAGQRRLLRVDIPGDEPMVAVEVTNSTPEADGTWKNYLLRVPPQTRTCQEAVAWTFDVDATDYVPAAET